MCTDDSHKIFETYKLHVELAERVASLREGLNRMYSGMITGFVAALILLHRLVPDTEQNCILPAFGIVVSLSWMLSLHSITSRLFAKHKVLVDLESMLPFDFLVRENQEFNTNFFIRRKWTGMVLPTLFLCFFAVWLVSTLTSASHC